MPFRFFQIPARGCPETESDLNGFLSSHRVLAVDRRWIDDGQDSFWGICVDFQLSPSQTGTPAGSASRGTRRNKVDYREILSDADFQKFAALRELRKTLAAEDGVPVYVVLTNDQMALIVQTGCTTVSDLKKIDGIGEARSDKYGDRILASLKPG